MLGQVLQIPCTDAQKAAWRKAAGDKPLVDWGRDTLNTAAGI